MKDEEDIEKTNDTSFNSAISKFVFMGEIYHRGRFEDNYLNIFAEMKDREKKAILRVACGMYHLFTNDKLDTNIERELKKSRYLLNKADLEEIDNSIKPVEKVKEKTEVVKPNKFEYLRIFTKFATIVWLLTMLLIMTTFSVIISMSENPHMGMRGIYKAISSLF